MPPERVLVAGATGNQGGAVTRHLMERGLEPRVPLYIIDVDDIGAFVAEAFHDRNRYAGKTFELAGDELTMSAMAARLSESIGIDVLADHVPIEKFEERAGEAYADMYRWFNRNEAQSTWRNYGRITTFRSRCSRTTCANTSGPSERETDYQSVRPASSTRPTQSRCVNGTNVRKPPSSSKSLTPTSSIS
ncbi:NmrA family NAD(P)-binding protein [Haladaptatus cibarius]|uniref:NmrA family NAD(P)-binding protein n=1 Tax=Haladaptatus cibarius TaxID=453847 RepID=UPI000678D279|nr:NmrA family NAD(P)-binding protein [Haladaptatus cibarius]